MRIKDLFENSGEAPGKKEVLKTTTKVASKYFSKKLNFNIEEKIPNFVKNYKLLRAKLDVHGSEARKNMPVVSYKQVKEFQKHLTGGFLDIKPPFNKDIEYLIGKFPNSLSDTQKEMWKKAGKGDGELLDDVIDANIVEIAAQDLKPVQEQIYLSKVKDNFKKKGIPHIGHLTTTKTLIVDKNNMIIDGHHRWTAVMIADPSIKMNVLKVDLNMNILIKVSKTFGMSIGNKQNA
jgi:hypothetical protein